MLLPPYQPLFDALLEFATAGREAEAGVARADYGTWTGEPSDADRSFESRTQSFLDWFCFDRARDGGTETPARLFAEVTGIDADERLRRRAFARTFHGLFHVRANRRDAIEVVELCTEARFTAAIDQGPVEGLRKGDLFESRLVPYDGALHFSSAFLFHPPHLRRSVLRELRKQRENGSFSNAREFVWLLARMAIRAEHYKAYPLDAIYDFGRPPSKVPPKRLKFDRQSVLERLGRVTPPPAGRGR